MLTTADETKIKEFTLLIESRGRRLKLQPADVDDAVQEIVPRLLNFQFDSQRSNGATERTVMIAVIDRSLRALRRRQLRHLARLNSLREECEAMAIGSREPALSYRDSCGLQADVNTALTLLSESEQRICSWLSQDYSVQEIANRMRCDWHSVQRQIEEIRRKFSDCALDAWLAAN